MWWTLVVGCGGVDHPSPSAAGGLVATYEAGEVRVRAGRDAPEVGLSLVGPAVPPARVGGRTEYAHGEVTEWWQRVPWGLEQGFDVAQPPRGDLVLELALTGAVAEVDANGLGATLRTESGGLRYERLAAWDERRVRLPARMEATDGGLRLVVDATEAVGAVTVDPLMTASSWAVESNLDSALYGTSVASAGDVNGDGLQDWIVGAPSTTNTQGEEGAAYLYLGSTGALSTVAAWSVMSGVRSAHLGESVASAGDVDGDGYDDVIVGAPNWDRGRALVYRGSAGGLSAAPAWTLQSSSSNRADLGASVASAGDVNGDGYDDVIVGAPYTYYGHYAEQGGEALVYLGSAAGLGTTPAWEVLFHQEFKRFGVSVASAGDVNGDGYDDVIVGAEGYHATLGGGAYLYLGSATGLSTTAAWTQENDDPDAYYGYSVATAGDVDGDGYDDVMVGSFAEGVSLYLGSAAGPSTVADFTVPDDASTVGTSVASAGDLNADGYGDLVLGSWSNQPPAAVVGSTVWLGSALGVSPKPAWRGTDDESSSVASAGDVNGDGYDELLIGSSTYTNPEYKEGAAFLFLGGAEPDSDGDTVPDLVDLCPTLADARFLDSDGDEVGNACDAPNVTPQGQVYPGALVSLVASGAVPGETVSFRQALGSGGVGPCPASLGGLCLDLGPTATSVGTAIADATGTARVVATVPATLQPGGSWSVQASIARGAGGSRSVKSNLEVSDPTVVDWDQDGLVDADETALGADPRDTDTDGDGLLDGADVPPNFHPTNADTDGDGVLDGVDVCPLGGDLADADADGVADACDVCPTVYDPTQVDSDGNGWGDLCPLLYGPAWTAEISPDLYTVASGDVNGDGYADVLVGSATGASMYAGSTRGPSAAARWTSNLAGNVAAAGDVNGDGFEDLLLGATDHPGGPVNEGAFYLFRGSAAGLPQNPTSTHVGTQANEFFGVALASAGDVNGDGYDDVIVGASGYSNGEPGEGAAFLYRGSAAGLVAAPSWTEESNTSNDAFGWAVASAGDVNGDGYDDVAISANARGAVYVYLGSAAGLSATPATTIGGSADLRVGRALAAADVDGDGYDDLVTGRFLGGVDVFFGSPSGLSTTAGWAIDSGQDPTFGTTVASLGDLNDDGYDDIGVGAPDNDGGAVFVYVGSPTGPSEVPDWTMFDETSLGHYGSALAGSGDVFGDGTHHVLVGGSGSAGYFVSGHVRLYTSHWATDADGDTVPDPFDLCPHASDPGQLDTDGDGKGNACDLPSLALDGFVTPGAPATLVAAGAAPEEKVLFVAAVGIGGAGPCLPGGACLDLGPNPVLLGWAVADAGGEARFEVPVSPASSPTGPYVVQAVVLRPPTAVASAPLRIDPRTIDWDGDGLSNAGEAVFHSDVHDPDTDGDGLLDGADVPPSFDPTNPDTDGDGVLDGADACPTGSNGDVDGDGALDGCDVCPTVYDPAQVDSDGDGRGDLCPVVGELAWTGVANVDGTDFGAAAASADVNGDGYDDVIVGSWVEGAAYAYLGSAVGPGSAPDWTVVSSQYDSSFGSSVASAGDVNGDGYDDVIVGAPHQGHGQAEEGVAYLYLGSGAGLASVPAWAAESNSASAGFGGSVASAGDVNGDGYDDVVVGAAGFSHGQASEGAASVYLGSAAGLSLAPAWFVESDDAGRNFGVSVSSAGDVDGDGYADVVVGSVGFDLQSGAAYVFRGSAAGLSSAPEVILKPARAVAVVASSAGDVNGDGYDDVALGDPDGQDRVSVHLGSGSGLSPLPAWEEAGRDLSLFGASIASGDMNGDGYDDLMVGAPNLGRGEVFLYLGSPLGLSTTSDGSVVSDRLDEFGTAVASGDVNGDGAADVIIGAPAFHEFGEVYLYPGVLR